MAEDILNLSLDDIIANKSKKSGGLKSDKPGTRIIGKKDETGRSRGRRHEESLKVTVSNRGLKRGAVGKRGSGFRILEVSRGQSDMPTAPRNQAALDGDASWEHDLYDGGPPIQARRIRPAQSGFKLSIENLDYKVSSEDIQELFENCGPLKKAHVIFDRSDRSTERAEVIFERRDDAVAALKRYNNLALDNKPMQITLVEDEGTAAGGRTLSSGIRIGGQRAVPSARVSAVRTRVGVGPQPGGMTTRDSNRGISRGSRQARGRGPAISQEELDKDLDSYMATD